ncbi:MAG: hypothetical protein P4L53_13070 [Candidatus Obscuribacterales bacterium]|nr:hypothetical protein [Candidatus Obscuribacterales bacterium]
MKIPHHKATIALSALLCAASLSLSVYAAPAETNASSSPVAASSTADKDNKESDKDAKETGKDSKDSKEAGKETGKDKAAGEKGKTGEKSEKASKPTPEVPIVGEVQNVTTDQLTEKPHDYLNKNVRFSAIFASFSTLPLDYKPAMRPAKSHVGLLVYRPNSKIPYSEIKLAMPMPKEKEPENKVLMDLHDGDTVEIVGKEFATPLDEPWLDVLRLKKTASGPESKKDSEAKEKEKAEMPPLPGDSLKSKNGKLEQKTKQYENIKPEIQETK